MMVCDLIMEEVSALRKTRSVREIAEAAGVSHSVASNQLTKKTPLKMDFVYRLEKSGLIRPLKQLFRVKY